MGASIETVTVDCADPARLATFWAAALGYEVREVDDIGAWIADPADAGVPMLFLIVPENKTVKNRLHLDLRPTTGMRAEVDRLVALGATQVGRVDEGGSWWTVLLDPEGNEFCVLRGPDDGWTPEGWTGG